MPSPSTEPGAAPGAQGRRAASSTCCHKGGAPPGPSRGVMPRRRARAALGREMADSAAEAMANVSLTRQASIGELKKEANHSMPPGRVRALFKKLDKDGSGGLSLEELKTGFAKEFKAEALAPHVRQRDSDSPNASRGAGYDPSLSDGRVTWTLSDLPQVLEKMDEAFLRVASDADGKKVLLPKVFSVRRPHASPRVCRVCAIASLTVDDASRSRSYDRSASSARCSSATSTKTIPARWSSPRCRRRSRLW